MYRIPVARFQTRYVNCQQAAGTLHFHNLRVRPSSDFLKRAWNVKKLAQKCCQNGPTAPTFIENPTETLHKREELHVVDSGDDFLGDVVWLEDIESDRAEARLIRIVSLHSTGNLRPTSLVKFTKGWPKHPPPCNPESV